MTTRNAAWFRAALHDRIQELLASYRNRAHKISPSSEPLVTSIANLLVGGKRLRALLAWWGWQGAGGSPTDPRILDAAAALELFQAAALIHDDILDRSDTRRGQPAVHKHFAKVHIDNQWAQDGEHFGVSAAILAGDLALGLSEEVFSTTADATAFAAPAREAFHTMRFEVMTGQYLDILAEVNIPDDPAVALDQARTVLRYKSAHYSAVWPFELGATLAGADDTTLSTYREFSLPLGLAFQLGDDLLGVFGNTELTGKPSGDDLLEGKRTELIAHALHDLPAPKAQMLNNFLKNPAESPYSVDEMLELVETSGAQQKIVEEIQRLGDEAFAALNALALSPSVHEGLEHLVHDLLHRQK